MLITKDLICTCTCVNKCGSKKLEKQIISQKVNKKHLVAIDNPT